jgi:hypothetical protein
MDSRHRPGNPVLLEWLAKEFEQSGYDVKRLVRAIVRSRAYQLDSKAPGSSVPPASAFARALDKPLSAEQLAASVLVATGNFPGSEARSEELRRAMVQKFPDFMPATYNPSLDQALFWANSPTIDALLQPKDDNTAAKLLAIDSPVERIKRAFLLVLGRDPDPAELAEMSSLTSQRTAENSVKDVLWAMLSSAEFQLNH